MPLGVSRQDPPPLPPSTTIRTTGLTSNPMAATERWETKGGYGSTVTSSDEDDLDTDKIVRMGTTKPAVLQDLAAAKDGHSVELARINEEDPDNDESTSVGARKLAWLQAAAAADKLEGGVSGTPRKKVRGSKAQFPVRLDHAYAAQS